MQSAPSVITKDVATGWEDFIQHTLQSWWRWKRSLKFSGKTLLNPIGRSYRTIAKTLNIPVNTTVSIICRWKVHRTTNNCPGQVHKSTLTLMIRKVREKAAVTWKEFQNDLKAAGTKMTQGTPSGELHCNLCSYTSCKSPPTLKKKKKKHLDKLVLFWNNILWSNEEP